MSLAVMGLFPNENDACVECVSHQVGSRSQAELPRDVRSMSLDSLDAAVQASGNLSISVALYKKRKHFLLPRA
jgi:hypothetical protein